MELEGKLTDARERAKKPKPHVGELGALLVEADPLARRQSLSLEHASQQAIAKLAAPEANRPSENAGLEKIRALLTGKRIETVSRAELLAASEKIVIDGTSLRQIFETHLIGEHGLRRLVAEYLKGGDLRAALNHEINERELDFERDPALRDLSSIHDSLTGSTVMQSKASLSKLLEKAASSLSDSSEEAAFYKAQADYQALQHEQHLRQRRWLDIGLVGTIAALTTALIVLYLMHR